MIDVTLEYHRNADGEPVHKNQMKILIARHPVTGQVNRHIGYANPENGKYSLIVQHYLRDSHIEQLDEAVDRAIEKLAKETDGGSES